MKTHPNAQAAEAAVMEWAASRDVVSQPAVLLLPDYASIDAFRHAHADDAALYGLTIATPLEWVSDRWELFGTGTRPVGSLERQMMIAQLLHGKDDACGYQMLSGSLGTIALISKMANEALPYILDADDVSDVEGLSPSERGVCELLRAYAAELDARGLTDYPLMLNYLATYDWPVPDVALLGIEELSPTERAFFHALSERTQVCQHSNAYSVAPEVQDRASELDDLQNLVFRPDGANPVRPTGSVRFLLPAGGYAWPRLLINEICAGGAASYLVSSKEPEKLFSQVAGPLQKAGYQVKAEYRVPVLKTYVGQLANTLFSAVLEGKSGTLTLCDMALNPLLGLPKRRSEQLDAQWRGNRLLTLDIVFGDLSNSSDCFAEMVRAVRADDMGQFLDVCSAVIAQHYEWTEQRRSQELSACESLRKQFQTASEVGLSTLESLEFCQRTAVTASALVEPDEGVVPAGTVSIATLERAARFAAASFDVAILTDLDASSYPVKEALSAKDILFEKLHLPESASPLERARRTFFGALGAPRQQLWLARVLKDADAQDLYPAVMMEEVLDCYREDLTQTTKGLEDKFFAIPSILVDYAVTAGEDELYQTFAIRNVEQETAGAFERSPLGVLSEEHADYVVASRKRMGDTMAPLLSPSALESYLNCPYGWFVQRRLKLSHPDVGFGQMEMGSFAHRVLHSLYKHLPEYGYERVTAESLAVAHELLDQRFDEHMKIQDTLDAYDNPLLPKTELEYQEVEALRRLLHDFVDRDAELLPGFKPMYLEVSFGNKEVFEYAGCALSGRVDRVDVDEHGHAVVIDYKANVGAAYQLDKKAAAVWADGAMIPQKIQTLIYAQVVRKVLGLQVVGALYVSYGKDGGVAGAVDPSYLGPLDIPGIKMDKCSSPGSLHDYLDESEELIAQAVQRLLSGDIRPEPRGDKPCTYCPVSSCDRRV